MQREILTEAHLGSSFPHTRHDRSQGPEPPGLPLRGASASPGRGGLGGVGILGQVPGREGRPASSSGLCKSLGDFCPLAEKYFPDIF